MPVVCQRRSGRPAGGRSGSRRLRIAAIGVILALLVGVPLWQSAPAAAQALDINSPLATSGSGPWAPSSAPTGDAGVGSRAGTLVVSNSSFGLASQFFGVNVHAVGVDNQSLAALVNATPFVSFRFSPAGEATNQATSV